MGFSTCEHRIVNTRQRDNRNGLNKDEKRVRTTKRKEEILKGLVKSTGNPVSPTETKGL